MQEVLLKGASFVLLVGGLIFVHELGHFVVAKLLNVKVVRFSIGFGPKLLGLRRGETEYQIAALPLGGYVKMAGDDPTEEVAPEDRGRGFLEQPPWKRLLIALAGPTFNLVFPGAIYVALAIAQIGSPAAGPVIGTVTPGSAADRAGLRPGDKVVSVAAPGEGPRPVRFFGDLQALVSPHPGEPLVLQVERGGAALPPLTLTPATETESNALESTSHGIIGVTPYYAPALVAPAVPGAAGPLEPFDLVVKAGGAPVKNGLELTRAVADARCRPLDLEVVRERPVPLPGAILSSYGPIALRAVPTCADGKPAFRLADPAVSTFLPGVEPGSPAEQAGIRRGDAIVSLNGRPVRSLARDLRSSDFEPGVPVRIALADGRQVVLTPGKREVKDALSGKPKDVPVIGFIPDRPPVFMMSKALLASEVPIRREPLEVVQLAVKQLREVVRVTVLGVVRIVTRKISLDNVGGPLMLFQIASEAAEEGWGSFLWKMALISVNLGLMNLLPIPVLDGGHIVQAALESITRRPLSVRSREVANIVGLILLFMLMALVFSNDIGRIARSG